MSPARAADCLPAPLLAAESVLAYTGPNAFAANDFLIIDAAASHRLTESRVAPGTWLVGRKHQSEIIEHRWIGAVEIDLDTALAWIRRDRASRALALARWARHEHRLAEPVAWTTTPEIEDLEPGVRLVRRFGRSGLLTQYRWGWEHGCSGWLPENPNRAAQDYRFYAALWCATHDGLDSIDPARLRILAVDEQHDEICPVSTPFVGKCKLDNPHRFVVAVLGDSGAELGRIVVCGKHLMPWLTDDDHFGDSAAMTAQQLSGRPGSWITWKDRACELTGELLTAALAVGRHAPWPDVRAALYAEAQAQGARRAAATARRAARAGHATKRSNLADEPPCPASCVRDPAAAVIR
ncbi:hypothetical protein [Nocardia brasiliensis]|uniref:hypothetical protein n=1 Tax=Nocardia brasiliensis TaxID=37326 RepID=UPI002454EB10|nr:hypothetical protein [Nocardia brasiliensis]